MASPDDELVWEQGTVLSLSDGDTLTARLTAGPGLLGDRRIRTIGVQAPEVGLPAECGAAQATDRLRAQLPPGAPVQARSVLVTSNDDYSGGRIVRSLYGQDEEGNWYDTSRGTVSDGWLMWFPLAADSTNKPEWAHNLEYRVLADDAAAERRGLWSANLCGSWRYPDMNVRVWAKYYGTKTVYIENNSPYAIDLSGWIIRDSAISGYRTLPAGTVIASGAVREVYSGDLNLNNLPASNPAFEGDAMYLMEPAGPFGTGNLRAWFPYPCNPDNCGDPQQGRVSITNVQYTEPPLQIPSAPGSVAATASTDGTGSINVQWKPPANLGGPSVTYTVTATSPNGGTIPDPASGITGLEHTFTGLTLGRAYTFTVKATNGAGTSLASGASGAVTPIGVPGAPTAVNAEPRDTAAVISWTAPVVTGGAEAIEYTATATNTADPSDTRTCMSPTGATSCTMPPTTLTNNATYAVTVRARNPKLTANSAESYPSATVVPSPYSSGPASKPDAPTEVSALAGHERVVVSWVRPANDGGRQITGYTATAVGDNSKACTTTSGETSCVVSGLTPGLSYTFQVVATNSQGSSVPSAASAEATPYGPYVDDQGPDAGAVPPAADPWIGGQMVELTASADTKLGGYGFWDKESSSYVNGGSIEDRAAYLFPMDQTLAAGQKLRVRFGAVPSPLPATSTNTTDLWTGQSGFLAPSGDFVELASLSRSSLDCKVTAGGSCRPAQQLSIASSPVGVTARTSPSSVAVYWGAPISRGGSPITGYRATAFDASIGGNAIASCTAGGGERSCSFGAGVGPKYYVEVVAHNAQGTSGPSWRVLAAPRTVPSAPGSVSASGTPGGVNVSWTPAAENGATITQYTASAYKAGTGGSPVGSCTTNSGSLTSCTIMRLEGGTQYFIDVVATNRAGNGAPSSPRVAGTPGPGGAVSTYSKGKVTVRWDPPAPGSNTITGYTAKLYTKSKGGTKVGECSAPAGKTSCTTKKMKKKRSKYYIDLSTQSAAGTFTVKPRIVTGPAKKASKPKVTSATPSAKRVMIAWAPPTFNGYSYLKGYGARLYSKSKGGKVKASCSAGPSTSTCTTKILKKGTYYSAVRVKNSKGWSSWSKRVKVVVR